MLASLNQWVTRITSHPDAAKLLLRLTVAGLILFHGVFKIQHGVGWIGDMLVSLDYPAVFAYGSYIGEVIAPIFVLLGIFTRPMALIIVFNMVIAVLTVHTGDIFTVTKVGAWTLEPDAFFFFGSITIALLGSGRFSVMRNPSYQ